MKIVDLNVLVYATDSTSARHDTARSWLDESMAGPETLGIPTAVAVGYVRLTTSARVMRSPLRITSAVEVVRGWYRRANVTAPQPTDRHFELLGELLAQTGVGGNLVSDAHLAVLAIEHGAEMYSFDRDFGRFSGVRWLEPRQSDP